MFDQVMTVMRDATSVSDVRWFWLVGLIAFGGFGVMLRTLWPARKADHTLKDYDGYIDDLLSTNGTRVRRDR